MCILTILYIRQKKDTHKSECLSVIKNYSSRFFVATTAIPESISTAATAIPTVDEESPVWGIEGAVVGFVEGAVVASGAALPFPFAPLCLP